MAFDQGRTLALAFAFMCAASGCSSRDAELERGIVGVWQAAESPEVEVEVVIDYRPGHESYYTWRSKADGTKNSANGTWSIKNGVITEKLEKWSLSDQPPPTLHTEIMSLKANELITRGEPGKHPDVYRRLSLTGDSSITSPPEHVSDASVPQAPPPTPAAPNPAPAQVQAASPRAFFDETVYVPTKEHAHLTFNIDRKASVLMLIDIDNQVPVDIVTLPTKWTAQNYENLKMSIAMGEASEMMSQLFGKEATEQYLPKNTTGINETSLFAFPLSKRGAYGHLEVRAELEPGAYTLFLDNTEDFTPTRGDAPVRVQLYAE